MKRNKNKRRNRDIGKQNDLETPFNPGEIKHHRGSRPLSANETDHKKNKALEGIKQSLE